jgi:hypothetical protein
MKYIAFIVLGLVLLAAIGFAVFIVPAPRAKMTVQAIGPVGATSNQPALVWSFAITNLGPCAVRYRAHAGVAFQTPEGTLAPGQGVVTNTFVPSAPRAMWAANLLYTPTESGYRRKVREWCRGVPFLGRFLQASSPQLENDALRINADWTPVPAAK